MNQTNQTETTFQDFFELGQDESKSPFITKETLFLGFRLPLRVSLLSAAFLLLAGFLSLFPNLQPLSMLSLYFVFFMAGTPCLIESIEDLLSFKVNIDVLMTMAAFSSLFLGSGFEGGLLLVLFSLSGAMEEMVLGKAKDSIRSLKKIMPNTAILIDEQGRTKEHPLEDIAVSSLILVRAGQIVPLDGIVIEGISDLNYVHITGESLPVTKKKGDSVQAGARNLDGSLTIEVTHPSDRSTLAKIIELVTEAEQVKPKVQRLFESFSERYALLIISFSFLTSLLMPYMFSIPFLGTEGSIYRSLAFLIAASPCALIIAIPITYLSAISRCAKEGILLKGGTTLDSLASCKMIAFDKTGTITKGELRFLELEPLYEEDQNLLGHAFSIALALEQNAHHPIAKALLGALQEKTLLDTPIEEFNQVTGYGIQGVLKEDKSRLYFGKPSFLEGKIEESRFQALEKKAKKIQESGVLLATLAINEKLFLFTFSDTLREGVPEVIASLKSLGLEPIMLTGDHEHSAKQIADQAGIERVFYDLTPEDKYKYITRFSEKQGLVMVGDGVNDAPALARATSSICMGKVGSTPAMDAADIILLSDHIEKLDWLYRMSTKTKRTVKQNLTLALVAIVFASIPALLGYVPLWLAVVLHEGGTVLVGLNGLRLLRA